MPSGTDPQRRPVYIDRVNNRLLAEPLGAGPWPVVTVTSPAPTVPPGTLTQAGIVQLNDSTSSNSTTTAATPSAVKAAYDLAVSAGSKAATTSSAGIVQLTDSVSSTSTTTAATPNSVKTAYDKATTAGTTSTAGIVQLTDSISSASTTTAATPNSVKSAYDLANAAIPMSLVDAKGDLLVASADNTVQRIAVGANDTVLTADSTAATGVKWAAPATGAWTLISAITPSGASSVVFTDLTSSYAEYIIAISYYGSNSYTGLDAQLSTNNGSSYLASNYTNIRTSNSLGSTTQATSLTANGPSVTLAPNGTNNFPGSTFPLSMTIRVTGAGGDGCTVLSYYGVYDYNGGPSATLYYGYAYNGSSGVNAIRFIEPSNSAQINGTFRLYGLKTS